MLLFKKTNPKRYESATKAEIVRESLHIMREIPKLKDKVESLELLMLMGEIQFPPEPQS